MGDAQHMNMAGHVDWSCTQCTLLNTPAVTQCDACGTARDAAPTVSASHVDPACQTLVAADLHGVYFVQNIEGGFATLHKDIAEESTTRSRFLFPLEVLPPVQEGSRIHI